jgi:hypothetical protein
MIGFKKSFSFEIPSYFIEFVPSISGGRERAERKSFALPNLFSINYFETW